MSLWCVVLEEQPPTSRFVWQRIVRNASFPGCHLCNVGHFLRLGESPLYTTVGVCGLGDCWGQGGALGRRLGGGEAGAENDPAQGKGSEGGWG